jgi:hypothetical protein
LVLGSTDGPSSLAASMYAVAELLKGWIDDVAANRVCWVSCSILVAIVLHFIELKTKLVVLGSERSVDLTKDEVDALQT